MKAHLGKASIAGQYIIEDMEAAVLSLIPR